jgi:hypothetical protein
LHRYPCIYSYKSQESDYSELICLLCFRPFIYLYEPDDVGEHEECGDVVHPLEEPEQDEGSPVDDEPGREDGPHAPYRQVLSHQGP